MAAEPHTAARDDTAPTRDVGERLAHYPLWEALLHRRSRRFASGSTLGGGPLAYGSRHGPRPLSSEEEAALAFAACGTTGYALAELPYDRGPTPDTGGGNIMVHFVGRTIASADALHIVTVFVLNDDGSWMLRRPQDLPRGEIADLIAAASERRVLELYERSRVRLSDGRASCRVTLRSRRRSTPGRPTCPAPPISCPSAS